MIVVVLGILVGTVCPTVDTTDELYEYTSDDELF